MYDHLTSGNWRNYPHNFVLLALVAVLVVIAVAVLLLGNHRIILLQFIERSLFEGHFFLL